jgi:hypothetical protein
VLVHRNFAHSAIAIALLVAMAIGIYFANSLRSPVSLKVIQSDCHFERGWCEVALSEASILRFHLSPPGLPAMEPLTLSITSSDNLDHIASSVRVWFEGVDMNMGQHFMLPVPENSLGNISGSVSQLSFTGMIPVCTIDEKMIWRLVVDLPSDQAESEQLGFSDETDRQAIHFKLR